LSLAVFFNDISTRSLSIDKTSFEPFVYILDPSLKDLGVEIFTNSSKVFELELCLSGSSIFIDFLKELSF